MKCRHCFASLEESFLDLGFAPPSNAYLKRADLTEPERYYPLRLKVCTACWLVQAEAYAHANELFAADYAYYSSTSSTWLEHAACYVRDIVPRLGLGGSSFVIEVACNDGYLLKNFVSRGIPCLGIEPAAGTAGAAEKQGIPVRREFFGQELAGRLAAEGKSADLIIGNNVLAHVPDINDFVAGLRRALKPGGTITLEFPHLMRLIEWTQFDTVYHEHFSYFSLYTVNRIFACCLLRVFDVEELPTHGGSLRVFACHADDSRRASARVNDVISAEERMGLRRIETYCEFQRRADAVKDGLLSFLIEQKRAGRRVASYGAAAKGNTLLNYAGVKPDLLPFVCDAASSKQGKFLPGSHIPVFPPAEPAERKPEVVLILPWNLVDEITSQHEYIRQWGGQFAVAVPRMRIL